MKCKGKPANRNGTMKKESDKAEIKSAESVGGRLIESPEYALGF